MEFAQDSDCATWQIPETVHEYNGGTHPTIPEIPRHPWVLFGAGVEDIAAWRITDSNGMISWVLRHLFFFFSGFRKKMENGRVKTYEFVGTPEETTFRTRVTVSGGKIHCPVPFLPSEQTMRFDAQEVGHLPMHKGPQYPEIQALRLLAIARARCPTLDLKASRTRMLDCLAFFLKKMIQEEETYLSIKILIFL